ncbi:MAG: hypothetical protein VKI81_07420 [Synechococcaceae cyanobacterium]|nr:hypothetical protein [Synechococcaceae cyanobacterium]
MECRLDFRIAARTAVDPISSRLRAMLLAAAAVGAVIAAPPAGWAGPPSGSTTPTLGEALDPSTEEQKALSEHLRARGALFYGAWWCPACFRQKHLFGKEAGNRLPYVECDKNDTGRERCKAAGIRAYPTWVLGESRLEGVQSLEELKRWACSAKAAGQAPERGKPAQDSRLSASKPATMSSSSSVMAFCR